MVLILAIPVWADREVTTPTTSPVTNAPTAATNSYSTSPILPAGVYCAQNPSDPNCTVATVQSTTQTVPQPEAPSQWPMYAAMGAPICLQALQSAFNKPARESITDFREITEKVDDENEEAAYQPFTPETAKDTFKDKIEPQDAKQVARSIQMSPMASGCSQFLRYNKDKDQVEMGSWGRSTLREMGNYPEAFGGELPQDVQSMCSNYGGMTPSQKNLLKIWMVMAIASGESGCKSDGPPVKAVHGNAVGLFQLWGPACDPSVSKTDTQRVKEWEEKLKDPNESIKCGIRRLAGELKPTVRKSLLVTPGKNATYWQVLHEGGSSKNTVGIIKCFPFCGNKDVNCNAIAQATGGVPTAPSAVTPPKGGPPEEKRKPATKPAAAKPPLDKPDEE